MSQLIRIKDAYSDIKLDDGVHVLVSATTDDIAVLKLFLSFPIGEIWSMNRLEFQNKTKSNDYTVIETASNYVLRAKNVKEVVEIMSTFNN